MMWKNFKRPLSIFLSVLLAITPISGTQVFASTNPDIAEEVNYEANEIDLIDISYQSLEKVVDDSIITVSGMMPDNAYITVEKLNAKEYEGLINETGKSDTLTYTETTVDKAFDIKIFYADGKEYQPVHFDKMVTVNITNLNVDTNSVYRVNSNNTVDNMNAETQGNGISFETNHFTTYVAGTSNLGSHIVIRNNQKYTHTDGNEYTYKTYDIDGDGVEDAICITLVTIKQPDVVVPEEIEGLPVNVFGNEAVGNISINAGNIFSIESALDTENSVTELNSIYVNTPAIFACAFGNGELALHTKTLTIGEDVVEFLGGASSMDDLTNAQFFGMTIDQLNFNAKNATTRATSWTGMAGYSTYLCRYAGIFYGANIKGLTFGNKVTKIPEFCFMNSTMNWIDINITADYVGAYAFAGTSLGEITLAENVSTFTTWLYKYSTALMDGWTLQRVNVFENCYIKKLNYNAKKIKYWYLKDNEESNLEDQYSEFKMCSSVYSKYTDAYQNGYDYQYKCSPFQNATIDDITFGEGIEEIPAYMFNSAKVNGTPNLTLNNATLCALSLNGISFNEVNITGDTFTLKGTYKNVSCGWKIFTRNINTVNIDVKKYTVNDTSEDNYTGRNACFYTANIGTVNFGNVEGFDYQLFQNCTINKLNYADKANTYHSANGTNNITNAYVFNNCTFGSIDVSEATLIPCFFMYAGSLTQDEIIFNDNVWYLGSYAFDVNSNNWHINTVHFPTREVEYFGIYGLNIRCENMIVDTLTVDNYYVAGVKTANSTTKSIYSELTYENTLPWKNLSIHGYSDVFSMFAYGRETYANTKRLQSTTTNYTNNYLISAKSRSDFNLHLLCDDCLDKDGERIEIKPTCVLDGGTYYLCTECGFYGTDNITAPALGHSHEEIKINYSLDTTSDTVKYCTNIQTNRGIIRKTYCDRTDENTGNKCGFLEETAYSYTIVDVNNKFEVLFNGIDGNECEISYTYNGTNYVRKNSIWRIVGNTDVIKYKPKANYGYEDTGKSANGDGSSYYPVTVDKADDGYYTLTTGSNPNICTTYYIYAIARYFNLSVPNKEIVFNGEPQALIDEPTANCNLCQYIKNESNHTANLEYALLTKEQYDAIPDSSLKWNTSEPIDDSLYTWSSEIPTATEEDFYYILTKASRDEHFTTYAKTKSAVCTHEYEFDSHLDPTCTEKGYDLYICSKCNHKDYRYIDALGHDFENATYRYTVDNSDRSRYSDPYEAGIKRELVCHRHCRDNDCNTVLETAYSLTIHDTNTVWGNQILGGTPNLEYLRFNGVDAKDCTITYDLNDGKGEVTRIDSVWRISSGTNLNGATSSALTVTWKLKPNRKFNWIGYRLSNGDFSTLNASVSNGVYTDTFSATGASTTGSSVNYIYARANTINITAKGINLKYDGEAHNLLTVNVSSKAGLSDAITTKYAVITKEQYDNIDTTLKETYDINDDDYTWSTEIPTGTDVDDYYILIHSSANNHIDRYAKVHAVIYSVGYTVKIPAVINLSSNGGFDYTGNYEIIAEDIRLDNDNILYVRPVSNEITFSDLEGHTIEGSVTQEVTSVKLATTKGNATVLDGHEYTFNGSINASFEEAGHYSGNVGFEFGLEEPPTFTITDITNGSYYFNNDGAGKYISNNKGKHNTTAETTFTLDIPEDNYTLDVIYSVSSETSYDKFNMYIDDVNVVSNKSGIVSETRYTKNFSVGTHTIKVTYAKDNSTNKNSDLAYIRFE